MVRWVQQGTNIGHLPNTSKSPLGPEEITRLSSAYEQALRTIGVQDRNDPLAELIARKIIEIGQTGLKDPARQRSGLGDDRNAWFVGVLEPGGECHRQRLCQAHWRCE